MAQATTPGCPEGQMTAGPFRDWTDAIISTPNGRNLALQSQVVRMLDPLQALSDVYWDKGYLDGLRQQEPMKPQAVLEFDDAPEIRVRLR